MIDVADTYNFDYNSRCVDYIDSDGNEMGLRDELLELGNKYNMPILLIDANEKS